MTLTTAPAKILGIKSRVQDKSCAANDDCMRPVPVLLVNTGYRTNTQGTRLVRMKRIAASSRTEAAHLLRDLRAHGYKAQAFQAGIRRAYRLDLSATRQQHVA